MASTSPFQRLRLDTSIRLLTVQPGSYGEFLHATLDEVDLGEPPEYEALSYTWGPVTQSYFIAVGGYDIEIRENLWNALQRLRHGHVPRVIWVDALCITQTDLLAKGKQVQIIGDIFSSASCVLVWLGEHADDGEKLFGEVHLSSDRFLQRSPEPVHSVLMEVACSKLFYDPVIWARLVLRPYWTRTWIVQELVLAKSIYVLCGHSLSTWNELIPDVFRKALPFERRWNQRTLPDREEDYRFGEASHRLSTINNTREISRRNSDGSYRKRSTIIELMEEYGRTKCEVPLDKIYALLSLDKAQTSQQILADYTIDTNELFLRVCLARRDEGDWDKGWFRHLYVN